MISVVMPAYNASEFIDIAIQSILNQTFKDFELIIIDDASTDNTLEIIKNYARQDTRIRIIQQPKNRGYTRAIMRGIEEAKYQWVARMDADDVSLPERLEKQINAAKANPKVVVWGSYVNHINSQGDILGTGLSTGVKTEEEFYEKINNGNLISLYHPTWLLNKEALIKAGGYNPEFEPAEDFELLSRLANYGSLLVIPEPLVLYRVHLQSASMQKFFLQQSITECIYARYAARIAGKEEPDVKDFLEAEKIKFILFKLNKINSQLSRFWYRKAGLFFGERQLFQAILHLALAIIFNPFYAIPRIWEQKIYPELSRYIHKINPGDRNYKAS
jgi:glycosyltransferase involved in cell wall biosynthesis